MANANYRNDELPTMSLEDFPDSCQRCPRLTEFVLTHEKLKAAAISSEDDKRYTARRAMRALRRLAYSRTGNMCTTGVIDDECGSTAP